MRTPSKTARAPRVAPSPLCPDGATHAQSVNILTLHPRGYTLLIIGFARLKPAAKSSRLAPVRQCSRISCVTAPK